MSFIPNAASAANADGSLTRPVGNSDTKKDVDKEEWASVPVKKRIFFNTEADAIANGYTKEGQTQTPSTDLPDGTGKKVLFDNTHGQTAGAADWVIDGGFSDFADALRADHFTVDQLERTIPFTYGEQAVTFDKLKDYDVFIIGEANIPYKKSEQEAMLQYVQNGGSIFFIADHYNADHNKNRWDASEVMNGYRRGAWENPAKGMTAEEAASPAMQGVQSSNWLADNFGIRFRYNALGDVDHLTDVVTSDQSFGITKDVASVAMHAGSTLAIVDLTKAKGLVYVPTNVEGWGFAVDQAVYNGGGRAEGPFAAISKVGAGKAAFIGDSSPVEDSTPKYLREENGSKKTTYDGFKGEANDATFLVQTVEWLANHETYTSFSQIQGLQLDQPTQTLAMENPATSTEPQTEPWAAPAAGYKWYDPTTYAAGSYGSSKEAPKQIEYKLVHQSTLPNQSEFKIRVELNNLDPNATVSGLKIGMYVSGGQQVAMFQNEDDTWPSSYNYSQQFSVTADIFGHASKELTVKINPKISGDASLRLKLGSDNAITESVKIGDVPVEIYDDTAPTTTAVVDGVSGENHYSQKDVNLSFQATDNPFGVGVDRTEYRINNGEWTVASGDVVLSEDGKNMVEFRSIDKHGNEEAPQSLQVWIDQTAPVIQVSGSTDFYQTDENVTFTATGTDTLSGVQSISFKLDNQELASIESINPLALTTGNHTLMVKAVDYAGNQETKTVTLTCKIDLDHLSDLISIGETKDWFANHGIAQSLQSKVENALKAKSKDQKQKLEKIIQEINKQKGKQIDGDFAELLLDDLEYIQLN